MIQVYSWSSLKQQHFSFKHLQAYKSKFMINSSEERSRYFQKNLEIAEIKIVPLSFSLHSIWVMQRQPPSTNTFQDISAKTGSHHSLLSFHLLSSLLYCYQHDFYFSTVSFLCMAERLTSSSIGSFLFSTYVVNIAFFHLFLSNASTNRLRLSNLCSMANLIHLSCNTLKTGRAKVNYDLRF